MDPRVIRGEILRYLDEDIGSGDVTTEHVVPPGTTARGSIVAREALVVAGVDMASDVFRALDPALEIEPAVADGTSVSDGARLASLAGRAAPILTGERVALNLLQRLSGIATVTRRFVDAVAGTGASVSDTRKTTPGLRALEKYAVRMGGGRNHRMGLFDAILIKDNHIAAAGGIGAALHAARARGPAGMPVQIEVDSLAQLGEALAVGVDAVLLDNMTPADVAAAVRLVRARPAGALCWIEASGGITLANIRAYAQAGVDTISVGALTHSAPAVDIALDFDPFLS
ncbi:MAG: carboxylating nicotinate-nucleotide diphosphorylase [Acidobacteria bacterium]|nr:carboxylating nicotinate-nucleotide diphosphorylase [Acidobacteriota bacterium]